MLKKSFDGAQFFFRLSLLCLVPILAQVSCRSLVVSSTPVAADVLIRGLDQSTEKPLGVAPQTLSPELLAKSGVNEPFVLVFRKAGYLDETVLIQKIPQQGALSLKLKPLSEIGGATEINSVVRLVLEGERYLIEKNSKEALMIAAKIKTVHPAVSAAFVIEGTALMIEGKKKEARSALLRAIEIDPTDMGSRNMIKELENSLGGTSSKAQGNTP
jgi:hypothetical protein